MSRQNIVYMAGLVALVGYVLPWVVNPGVGLTLGAYDLAEWASLHPEVRGGSPALLLALLLRLPLLLLTLLIAFAAPLDKRNLGWWFSLVLVLLLIGTALPPLEFLTEARGDPNYRQQFALTVIALIGAGVGLSGLFSKWREFVVVGVALAALLCSVIGLWQARQLMIGFSMPVAIGLGAVLMIIALAIGAAVTLGKVVQ